MGKCFPFRDGFFQISCDFWQRHFLELLNLYLVSCQYFPLLTIFVFIVCCSKIHYEKADFKIPIKYAPFGGFRGLKKNFPLMPVRIEVLCFYTFFENFKFLAFEKTLLNTPHLESFSAVNTLFFWFQTVIFAVLVSRNLMQTH